MTRPGRNMLAFACCLLLTVVGCRERSTVETQPTPSDATSVSTAGTALEASTDTQPADALSQRRRKLKYPKVLSEYGLFRGNLADQQPADGVVPYNLNTPLFTDYATKQRFVKLPAGATAPYNADQAFDFPVGTVIAKTFGHDYDMTDLGKGRRLIETRILRREKTGWIGLPYVWNEQQTEATLSLTGAAVDVQWIHSDGKPRQISHLVPNVNDCKRCHVDDKPIGPRASQINGDFAYDHGAENQLAYWSRIGILSGAPKPDDAPRLAVWNDESTGSVDDRARAWLEINCAHCHSETGPARNSGLHLHAAVTDPFKLGVFKGPVAAGKGTGGRQYDIVPGKPQESILMYRLETTHPGEVMPEFGRSLVDEEANELIRQWIANMPDPQATAMLPRR